MRRLLTALRQGWGKLKRPRGPLIPFRVSCNCGQSVQGIRGPRHQIVRCPACGASLFVFPPSPLPRSPDEEPLPEPTPPRARSPWFVPAVAAGLTLAVVALGLVLFFSKLFHPEEQRQNGGTSNPPVAEVIDSGKKLLAERGFREASRLLQKARDRGEKHPELVQLHRQAQLLAGLLDLPVEEIIEKGQRVRNPGEWQAQLQDYKGRTVLFDDLVRREQDGSHRLVHYEVIAGEEKAIVRLDLELLRRLPLEQPRRVIFGARLANVARGAGGIWVVEFERDSGVLLTDEGAATALGLDGGEVQEVLREQVKWSRGAP